MVPEEKTKDRKTVSYQRVGDIITKNGKKDLLHVEGKEREDIRDQSLSLLPFLLLNFRDRRRMSRLDKKDNRCRKNRLQRQFRATSSLQIWVRSTSG